MTRTDQVKAAVEAKLEEIRQSLDVDASLRVLRLEVRFNDGGNVRSARSERTSCDELQRPLCN